MLPLMQSHSHSLNIHGQVQFFSYPGMETVHFLVVMMTLDVRQCVCVQCSIYSTNFVDLFIVYCLYILFSVVSLMDQTFLFWMNLIFYLFYLFLSQPELVCFAWAANSAVKRSIGFTIGSHCHAY